MKKLLLLLIVLVGTGWSQTTTNGSYYNTVLDSSGHPISNAVIKVYAGGNCGTSCNSLASIFYDFQETVPVDQTIAPIVSDINGNYHFFAQSGAYDIVIHGRGVDLKWTNSVLGASTTGGLATGITPSGSNGTFWGVQSGVQGWYFPFGLSGLTVGGMVYANTGTTITTDAAILTDGMGTLSASEFNGPQDGIVGGMTPFAGTFTTLISTGGALNGTIGATTPAAGAFTTGTFSGSVTAKSYNTVLEADQYCTTPGTLDDTCLRNALTALPANGGAIHVRAGTYTLAAAVVFAIPSNACVTIFGDGQDQTFLAAASTTEALHFNYGNPFSCVTVQDLSMVTSANGLANGLTLSNSSLNSNPALGAISTISRVALYGNDGHTLAHYWANAILINNVSNVNIDSVNVMGATAGSGVLIQGLSGSSSYAVQVNITKSFLDWVQAGVVYGSYVQGVSISQTQFTADTYGVWVPGSETGGLDQLNIADSQFGTSSRGVYVQTSVSAINIHNNLFFAPINSAGVELDASNAAIVAGNQMICTSLTGTAGISVTTTTGGVVVDHNIIAGCQAGVADAVGTTNLTVLDNYFDSNTVNFSHFSTSTNTYFVNNRGYNPVGVSSPTPSSSPWTYTNGYSPATCYIRASTNVTQVSVGGTNLLAANVAAGIPVTVELGPNEAAIFTYTGTATLVCSVH